MSGTENTRLTPLEVCTLIAHEAVSMLDTVQTELPSCMKDFRTALEALHTIHALGKDGETLLAWVDTEVANAERFIADGIPRERLVAEKAALYHQLAEINRQIRAEKKKLALCREICARLPQMEQEINQIEAKEVIRDDDRRR